MDEPPLNIYTLTFNDFIPFLYILLILFLLFFSAIFSAIETSFSCLNQFKIKVKADEGDKKAKKILKAYERFDNTLIMSLIGHNVFNVILSTISTILFMLLFNTILDDTWISLISTAVMTILTYIFADMLPKIVARKSSENVAYSLINIANFFYYLLFPLIFIFSLITRLTNKIFKVDEIPSITEEDFSNIVDEIEEEGYIEENESEIISNSLDFSNTSVGEILTKREKMFVIDIKGLDKDTLNNIIIRTPYSRIPIIYQNKDKVIGVLHVKSYIKAVLKEPNVSILSTLQKPYFISYKIKLDDLLDGFKAHHTHIAIVRKDDKTIGMVTMEDVLEELVGKIAEGGNN